MTESQLERLLDKLEEIRCGIIDVETEAQGIKELAQQHLTQAKSSGLKPTVEQIAAKVIDWHREEKPTAEEYNGACHFIYWVRQLLLA